MTKDDILDFYKRYFHPSSTTRAKTCVHLIAQSSAEDIAAKMDPKEQTEKLAATLGDLLSQLGLTVDSTALAARLGKVDVHGGDSEGIADAMSAYLTETAGLAEEQLAQVVAQGKAVLAQLLPSLGIRSRDAQAAPAVNGEARAGRETNGENAAPGGAAAPVKEPVVIEDVKAWKATMPVSAGARPVKDLGEFEELEAKL